MARRQLNIRIEEDIHTKVKVTAILKGITLNDYIEQAIQKALEQDKNITSKAKKL
jgi:predicted HicB family RNase H-like nuclease